MGNGRAAERTAGPLSGLPDPYWRVPYVGMCIPGRDGDLADGANCQRWAYAVLAHFGHSIPPVRSSGLWADASATQRVDVPEPLDLMLFNDTSDPYGAHVGIWTGHAVAHLCREVGVPAVWDLADLRARPRYAVLVGIKRPVARWEHSGAGWLRA